MDDNEQASDDDVTEEQIIEGRNKFLMLLKSVYWELLQNYKTRYGPFYFLQQSANWDLDNEQHQMSSWEFISSGLWNTSIFQQLFQFRFMPLIGNFIRSILLNHVCFTYEVVYSYIDAHIKAHAIFQNYNLEEKVKTNILVESYDNKRAAEQYLYNYLNISYPEIISHIQTKRAALHILDYQKDFLLAKLNSGQIDDLQYFYFKKKIDVSTNSLQQHTPDWNLPPIKEFLKQVPLFQFLENYTLDILIKEANEEVFETDSKMVKELNQATYLYVITRGTGTEISDKGEGNYREKKSVGDVVSYLNLISQSLRYETSFLFLTIIIMHFIAFVNDCVVYASRFNLSSIKKLMKFNLKILEFVWKESLPSLIKLYPDKLAPLGSLTREEVLNLLKNVKFAKYKKEQFINFTHGGIFLRGKAKIQERNKIKDDMYDDNAIFEEIDDQAPEVQDIKVFIPRKMQITLYLIKTSYLLHFLDPKSLKALLNPQSLRHSKSSIRKTETFRSSLNCDFRRINTVNMFKQ